MNYHVPIDEHFYSAPHHLRKEEIDARLTAHSVEFFHKNKRVAAHQRNFKRGYTTVGEHMPKAHREYAEWTPERLVKTTMNGRRLLDTNIIIALFAGEYLVLDRLARQRELFVSSIVVGELYYGAFKSHHRKANLQRIDEFVGHNTVLDCNAETARFYGAGKRPSSGHRATHPGK